MRLKNSSVLVALTITLSGLTGAGAAQATGETDTPYAGHQARSIKALSPQQIDDYLHGRGLGYALAAELNHYPGPRHVLDLAGELALTDQQVDDSQALFDTMQAAAVDLGKRLVELERQLDHQFAAQSAEHDALRALLGEIGALEAQLRFVHLSAHIKQKALLTAHQVHSYDQLRGYGAGGEHGHAHGHKH